jgi:hypothetical protein
MESYYSQLNEIMVYVPAGAIDDYPTRPVLTQAGVTGSNP